MPPDGRKKDGPCSPPTFCYPGHSPTMEIVPVELFSVNWPFAIALIGMGAFTLGVAMPGVDSLARGSHELRMPPMSPMGRRALTLSFAVIGAGFIIAGVVVIVVGLASA